MAELVPDGIAPWNWNDDDPINHQTNPEGHRMTEPTITTDTAEAAARAAVESRLSTLGGEWRDAANEEVERRAARDEAIKAAHAVGFGVREIARAVGIDATTVSRLVRPKAEAGS